MPSTIDVALFQRSFTDTVVKINNNSISPQTFNQLLSAHPEIYFTADDPDGVKDFCAHIPAGTTMTIEAVDSSNNHYTLTSQIFVGPIPQHPPTR